MLTQTVKVVVIIIMLLALFMYSFQRNFIYIPSPDRPMPNNYDATDMKVVTLHTQDNIALNAWYKKAPANHPTIIYFHGNAGNIGGRMPQIRQFINNGFGVLLFDYRGYGGNKGSPTELGLYKDGQAALNYLHDQGVAPSHIVLYGESLGTGVVTMMATQSPVCAIVLQSPYTSLADAAHSHYPWIPLAPWDKYDSRARIQSIKVPLLVFHGTKDTVVPYNQGVELFNAANNPKNMVTFPGYGHSDLWQSPLLYQELDEFTQKYCP